MVKIVPWLRLAPLSLAGILSTGDNRVRRASHMSEIGDFLRTRRAAISPESAGIVASGHRRVPGLRREELATLAGVSAEYYTRVEQGRVRPSIGVIDAIARALRLDEPERKYLQALVRPTPAPPHRQPLVLPSVIEQIFSSLILPAIVVGPRGDILAFNFLAEQVVFEFSALEPEERNFVRIAFTEPAFKERDRDWDVTAERWVAFLRADAGRDPGDERLQMLVRELSTRSAQFAALWAGQRVAEKISGHKRMRHPDVGNYEIDFATLQVADARDIVLIVYSAAPGTSGDRALRLLSAERPAERNTAA
jgi:transcriptional regulator with XRE-family HTH domain